MVSGAGRLLTFGTLLICGTTGDRLAPSGWKFVTIGLLIADVHEIVRAGLVVCWRARTSKLVHRHQTVEKQPIGRLTTSLTSSMRLSAQPQVSRRGKIASFPRQRGDGETATSDRHHSIDEAGDASSSPLGVVTKQSRDRQITFNQRRDSEGTRAERAT